MPRGLEQLPAGGDALPYSAATEFLLGTHRTIDRIELQYTKGMAELDAVLEELETAAKNLPEEDLDAVEALAEKALRLRSLMIEVVRTESGQE